MSGGGRQRGEEDGRERERREGITKILLAI